MPASSFQVQHQASIDSTNLEARRQCNAGNHGPLWLRADEQTAGRGRLDRAWQSPPGNLYTTLLLPTSAPLHTLPQLGFAVALAVHDVVRHVAPDSRPMLKWPNDCLVGGAKIAGILCEVLRQQPSVVALGCGINVAHAPSGLAYPATCLSALGASHSLDRVFEVYARCLSYWLSIWNEGSNFAALRTAWTQRAAGISEQVSMTTSSSTTEGVMTGISDDGALLLDVKGKGETAFHAGDLLIPSLQELRKRA